MILHFGHDLRAALRHVLHRPLFLGLGAVALAVGLAATLLVVGVLNTLLWRDLPGITQPHRQLEIGRLDRSGSFETASYPDFRALRERGGAFDRVYAWQFAGAYLGSGERNEHALALLVSGDYFDALGVVPALGTLIGGAHADVPGSEPVVVASHAAWHKHFGGDPEAIGRTVRLNGMAYTLIGVTAQDFRGHLAVMQPEFYVPLGMAAAMRTATATMFDERRSRWIMLGARLAAGRSLADAEQAIAAYSDQLQAVYPAGEDAPRYGVAPLRPTPQGMRGVVLGLSTGLLVLCAAVLALACSNLAGVLLAQGEARSGELSLRSTLGATRARIAAQLLAETMPVAVLAGGCAIAFAWGAQQLWQRLPLPVPFPLDLSLTVDGRMVLFAVLATAAVALGFGLLPALRLSATAQSRQLGSLAAGHVGGRQRLRLALLALQSMLTVTLLVVAGLSLRSLQAAAAIDTGFVTDDVYIAPVDLTPLGIDGEAGAARMERIVDALRGRNGIDAASYASVIPLSMSRLGFGVARVPGGDPQQAVGPDVNTVGPGFFDTFGIDVQGRAIEAADLAAGERVAVINRTLARRLFGAGDPLGREFELGGDDDWTRVRVVGVAADGRYASLDDAEQPFAFLAAAQWPRAEFSLIVRGPADAALLRGWVADAVHGVLPDVPQPPLHRFEQVAAISIMPQRIVGMISAALGALALLLAGTGMYGVLAMQIERRQREFGVRRALGAGAGQVIRVLVQRSLHWVAVGTALGLVLAALLAAAMQPLLLGVAAHDPVALAGALLSFVAMLVLATVLPLRRALRLQPMEALRYE